MTARDEVLARIRAALTGGQGGTGEGGTSQVRAGQATAGQLSISRARDAQARGGRPGGPWTGRDPAGPEARPAYRTQGSLGQAQLLDLLAERVADYRAAVRRCGPAGLTATVTAALAGRGARRIVRPPGFELPGLEQAALPAGIELVADYGLSAAELDAVDGVITGAAVAIAGTGTIILDGSADQGRRVITLVPDYHLCVVRADQVVELVPEAIARLAPHADRPLTWISGPSATSDIELNRVEGVHGPRTLEVILVAPEPGQPGSTGQAADPV